MIQSKKIFFQILCCCLAIISFFIYLNIYIVNIKDNLIINDFNDKIMVFEDANLSTQNMYKSAKIIRLEYLLDELVDSPSEYPSNKIFNYESYDSTKINYDSIGVFVFNVKTNGDTTIIYLCYLENYSLNNNFTITVLIVSAIVFLIIYLYIKITKNNQYLCKELTSITKKQITYGTIESKIELLLEEVRINKNLITLYEEILYIAKDGLIVCDKNLNVLYCNKLTERFVGFRKADRIIKNSELFEIMKETSENKFVRGHLDLNEDNFFYHTFIKEYENQSYLILHLNNVTDKITYKNNQINFFNNASHELRTPLTTIQGFIELLLLPNLKEDHSERLLKLSFDECKKMEILISSIIDISKRFKTDDVYTKINFAKIVNSCIEENLPANIAVEKRIPKINKIICNDVKIEIVISSIINNAFVHNVDKGYVKIDLIDRNGYIEFIVKNSCVELTDEEYNAIFEPFSNVSTEKSKTTGLGLSLVKAICEAYNYTLEVNHDKGIFEVKILFYSDEIQEEVIE